MELQKNILLFFSNIHTPFLDKLVQCFTVFGEALLPLAISLFLLWCVDKKKGVISTMILMLASVLMSFVKAVVRFPRPWVLVPELQSQRMQTATGYSFPSGHSTTASSFYSSLAFQFKKRALSIVCALLILIVPLSRLYLCVHWPLDVFCGTLLGFGTCVLCLRCFSFVFENRKKYLKQMSVVGICFASVALGMSVLLQFELVDFMAFSDFSKNLAMLGGALIGFALEEKYFDFTTDGSIGQKALRYIVGMAGSVFFLEGLKLFLPYIPMITFLRYFSVTFWAGLYPLVGKKLKLFN